MRKSTKICAALGVVAGLGVAVAPLSVFAAGTRTDTLNVTVGEACTINNVAIATANDVTNTYTGSVTPGQIGVINWTSGSGDATAENTFTIVCNYANGYFIRANAGNLEGTGDAQGSFIAPGTVQAGASAWDATITTNGDSTNGGLVAAQSGAMVLGTNTTVATNAGASKDGGDTFHVAYGVSAAANQEAGLYTGTVTYTLIKTAD